jgi:hypothetical protein
MAMIWGGDAHKQTVAGATAYVAAVQDRRGPSGQDA